jgi:hypothetical protein
MLRVAGEKRKTKMSPGRKNSELPKQNKTKQSEGKTKRKRQEEKNELLTK